MQLLHRLRSYFSLPGAVLTPIIWTGVFLVFAYILFSATNSVSYWTSAGLFVLGIVMSYHISRNAGFDGALSHFREIIVGSIHVGLISIKKLSDTPPEKIAAEAKSSLQFVGIAGEKFLTKSMQNSDFLKTNKNSSDVRIMLMDPFSEDISRLTKDQAQQKKYIHKIISTIVELSVLSEKGYKFEVRLYPKLPPLRLLICDKTKTAISTYALDTTGWKNAQLIFDAKDSPDSFAPHFLELFDDIWERGVSFNLILRSKALRALVEKEPMPVVDLGMVHGRFQPFHHEHLEYILHGINHSKKCLIGITQPDLKSISECKLLPHRGKPEGNPFTFKERSDMIKLSLMTIGIPNEKYEIFPFDIDKHEESIPDIISKRGVPTQFIKLFSDWEFHKMEIFQQYCLKITIVRDELNEYSHKNVSGTLVRELISSNRNWYDFVPVGTRQVINRKQSRKRGYSI